MMIKCQCKRLFATRVIIRKLTIICVPVDLHVLHGLSGDCGGEFRHHPVHSKHSSGVNEPAL